MFFIIYPTRILVAFPFFLPQGITLIFHLALCLPFQEPLYQCYEAVPFLSSFVAHAYQCYVYEVPPAASCGTGHVSLVVSSLRTTGSSCHVGRHSECLGSGHRGWCLWDTLVHVLGEHWPLPGKRLTVAEMLVPGLT